MNKFLSISSLALFAATAEAQGFDTYACSYCVSTVESVVQQGNGTHSLVDGCKETFPRAIDMCNLLSSSNFDIDPKEMNGVDSRKACQNHGVCVDISGETWRNVQSHSASSPLDIRVSKAYGSRGYNNIRLSVISNESVASEYFTYSEPFKYRWNQYHLNTGVAAVKPGEKTTFTIAGEDYNVYIPPQGGGTRGVIIADPCISSEFIVCMYARKFDTFNHLTSLLNAINSHDDVHFWNILGDNFYDQTGYITSSFFDALSKESKTKVMGSVPGNHDFWVKSSPAVWTHKDQLGNGFMQFLGQDVAASEADPSIPYDFRNDPDAPDTNAENLPPTSNYFYYNQVGNVGFIGYSGAHTWEDTESYFESACEWAATTPGIDVLLLLGHWHSDGSGCEADMTVPAVYQSIAAIPACEPVASKMRYMLGHRHCNMVMEEGKGFMVGAMGMEDHECGEYGVPVVDTTDGTFKMYYFLVQSARPEKTEVDNYDEVISCITENGVSGCYHLATLWDTFPLV